MTGTLVTVPAAAAVPTVVAGVTAAADAANLPVDSEVVSVGNTGYLTSRRDDGGNPLLEWHKYADGSVMPIHTGVVGYDSNSDTIVTGDGGSMFVLIDMKGAQPAYSSVDIGRVGPGAKLVGVVNQYLFVSVETTGDYHDLYQVAYVNGVVQKTKLSSRPKNIDYKVVASAGNKFVVLGSVREPYIPTDRIVYWSATSDVNNGSVVDWGGSSGTAEWDRSSTGALTAGWQGWVHTAQDGGLEFSAQKLGTTTVTRFPLTGELARAVVAGIVGDTVFYGVPGTATAETPSPLYARSLTDASAQPYKVLDNFSSAAHAPDGSLLVRGFGADGDGLFRISDSGGARPAVTLEAGTGRVMAVQFTDAQVPSVVGLEKAGTTVPMHWSLSRGNAAVDLTLTHVATGKKLTRRLDAPVSGNQYTYAWNGVLDGISAPNGAYTWKATATPTDGIGGPASLSGGFRVQRQANAHDLNDNGSTDVVARDASGNLWRDDLFDWPVNGQATPARRTRIGTGWQVYKQIEAVGDIAGSSHGDLIALDGSGYLWHHLGKGDGTLAPRVRIGGGWGGYKQLAGGSDLNGDGRSDLLATDASGVLWFYKGTGSSTAPFAPRVRVGGGWGVYNQITATGDIAGAAAGDLVARDTSGVLWLHLGYGNGTFAPRIRVGGGWGAFSQLVGAGDVTNDGRPDLIAYGSGGTYVYRSTGSSTAPFGRQSTTLYAGEGAKFNSVS
ncbi:VCBS repeat-containing protein [Streptomyces globisporus]|uniref:VCBS repeat-containing protein n=1 Tax=Streptomyces globisporus TaxID=1908 RepID=UPI001F3CE6CF|nr:VCBS repeat-containing protein [Streptomyces globisporus]